MMTRILLGLALGMVTWTFLEYCIHRWLGHDKRFRPNFFGEEHIRHHSEGNYFSPAWKKAVVAGVILVVLLGPALLLGGKAGTVAFLVGLVSAYLGYEWYHHQAHVAPGATRYTRFTRRHHFYHHFVNPKVNHGVTTPLWDWVFRTYEPVEHIRVPRRLQMPWLSDPESGEVRSEHQAHYSLRGPKAR